MWIEITTEVENGSEVYPSRAIAVAAAGCDRWPVRTLVATLSSGRAGTWFALSRFGGCWGRPLKRHNLQWNLLELRHTFGSQLARKGVSLLKIAKLMGNSPAIASWHYINLVPEEIAGDVEF